MQQSQCCPALRKSSQKGNLQGPGEQALAGRQSWCQKYIQASCTNTAWRWTNYHHWGCQKKNNTEGWCKIGSEHQRSCTNFELFKKRIILIKKNSHTIFLIKEFSINLVWIGLRVIWGDHMDCHGQVEAVHQRDVKVILRSKKSEHFCPLHELNMSCGNDQKSIFAWLLAFRVNSASVTGGTPPLGTCDQNQYSFMWQLQGIAAR